MTVQEYWEAVTNKYIPPPPILIPSVDEDYVQQEPLAMTIQEESKQLSTFDGHTFENYSNGNENLDSFFNGLDSEESEGVITYEDLITEEDNFRNGGVPQFENNLKPTSSKPQMFNYVPKPFKTKFQHTPIAQPLNEEVFVENIITESNLGEEIEPKASPGDFKPFKPVLTIS